MKGIHQGNIVDYLQYLEPYLGNQRFDTETLHRWTRLSDMEIGQYLGKLYEKYRISPDQGAHYELSFLQQSHSQAQPDFNQYNPSSSRPVERNYQAPNQSYTPPPPPPPKKKGIGATWGFLIAVGVMTILAFIFFPQLNEAINGGDDTSENIDNNNPDGESYSNTATVRNAQSYYDSMGYRSDSIPQIEETASTTTNTESSQQAGEAVESTNSQEEAKPAAVNRNKAESNIYGLIRAEDNHQSGKALSYFSPEIKRYWGTSNPSRSDMENLYNQSWSKIKKSESDVLYTNWVNPNTCDVTMDWTYEGANSGETKTVRSKVRYTFDSDGKITSVNKVN